MPTTKLILRYRLRKPDPPALNELGAALEFVFDVFVVGEILTAIVTDPSLNAARDNTGRYVHWLSYELGRMGIDSEIETVELVEVDPES